MVMQKIRAAVAVASSLSPTLTLAIGNGVSVSGSIRTGLEATDPGWQIIDNDSRIRFQASSHIGSNQKAFVNYQLRVNSAMGSIAPKDDRHLSYVGITGDWGSFSVGTQWSTAFNTVGTFIDKSFRYGGTSLDCVQYRMRHSVLLITQLGDLKLMGDLQMAPGDDSLDRATVGGLLSNGRVSIAGMYQSAAEDCLGVAAAVRLGDVELSGGFVEREGGASGWDINGSIGKFWIDLSASDLAGEAFVATYTLNLAGETDLVFEGTNTDGGTRASVFLRYDF